MDTKQNNILLINNYIDKNFQNIENCQDALIALKKISQLVDSFQDNSDFILELVHKNIILHHILKIIVDNNIETLKKYRMKNNTIALFIETYCMLYNIDIEENEETLLTNKEEVNTLKQYLSEIGKYPLLTIEEEKKLAIKVKQGDEQAKQEFIKRNLRLVVSIAKKYTRNELPFLDLIQEGNLGLITAVERYDVEKGYRFSTYAFYWIKQSIIRSIINTSRNIRIPVYLYEQIRTYSKTVETLSKQFNHQPTIEEIAQAMNISLEEVIKLQTLYAGTVSINSYINDEKDSELEEFIPSKEDLIEDIAMEQTMKDDVYKLLQQANLTKREMEILILRYGIKNGYSETLEEISRRYGVTKERIRQLELKAMNKIRKSNEIKKLADYMDNPQDALLKLKLYNQKKRMR